MMIGEQVEIEVTQQDVDTAHVAIKNGAYVQNCVMAQAVARQLGPVSLIGSCVDLMDGRRFLIDRFGKDIVNAFDCKQNVPLGKVVLTQVEPEPKI